MFRTIGHTFELMGMSWKVLKQDRQLLLFPVLAGATILLNRRRFRGHRGRRGHLRPNGRDRE